MYAIIIATLNVPDNNLSLQTTSSIDSDISPPDGDGPDHTIPTLLSIVNPETGKYINALENPLYDLFKTKRQQQQHRNNDDDKVVLPKLFLNKKRLKHPDESLTVSWTPGYHLKTKKAFITDNDLIALYCSNDDRHNTEKIMNDKFLEVATIGQVRATSMRHLLQLKQKMNAATSNSWYIPRFPILRKRICQFVLYSSSTPSEEKEQQEEDNEERLRNSTTTIPIAYSDTIELYNPLTPTAIHLAVGTPNQNGSNDETVQPTTSMVVQFTTGYYDDDQGYVPVVRYGKVIPTKKNTVRTATTTNDDDADEVYVRGTSRTYTSNDMCESPANVTEAGKFYPPGMLHVVELFNLETNTKYWYQVAVIQMPPQTKITGTSSKKKKKNTKDEVDDDDLANQDVMWSDRYTFLSPPPLGTSAGEDTAMPFSYAVYGDQGCPESGWGYDGGVAVSNAIAKEASKSTLPFRAVHHIGDLAYANGAGHVWDEWFRILNPFSTRIPLMVGVGNHVSFFLCVSLKYTAVFYATVI